MTEEHWVLREDQLRCLVSATRLDIVDHLAAGGVMSIKELAEVLGRQPSTLYHHLEKLLAVGLVREAGKRVVNRRQERLYATPARRMRLKRALEDPGHSQVMGEIVGALTRQAERDFSRGQASSCAKADGPTRNLGFFRLVSRPDRARLVRINSLLEELAEAMWDEGDGETTENPVMLTWVLAPGQ